MEVYRIYQLNFAYPGESQLALDHISITIEKGQFITLCGPSGSGKSTLLRHLKSDLTPHGYKTGTIDWNGEPLCRSSRRTQAESIGYVGQSPEDGIVTDKVWHELAFGLENLGYAPEIIRLRIAEMAHYFGIERWYHEEVSNLSGGQKQILQLAAAMVTQPSVLLLDEPTSQLDPIAATEFFSVLARLHREFGTTVLLVEHRLEEALALSQRVIVLEDGHICADGTPRDVGGQLKREGKGMFFSMPTPMRIYAGVDTPFDCPVTIGEGKQWLDLVAERKGLQQLDFPKDALPSQKPILSATHLWFRYEKQGPEIIKNASLSVYEGECYGILGGNGAGKSTLLALLGGLLLPQQGKIKGIEPSQKKKSKGLSYGIGVLPQSPQTLFSHETVEEELLEMVTCEEEEEALSQVKAMAVQCRIFSLLKRHPYDLSGGEQQRVALCKVLLQKPDILLLDEPTKGMDGQMKAYFGTLLRALQKEGLTFILVSHDVEFCAMYTDRCALLFDGSIVLETGTRQFFCGNRFYTTAANRMARHLLPQAITVEDVITACGGKTEPPSLPPEEKKEGKQESAASTPQDLNQESRKHVYGIRVWAELLIVLLLIPCTIGVGVYGFHDRTYALISVLLLVEMILPFFLLLEGRRPQAREIVLLATLCAIGVAGRGVFAALPQVKPVASLVIISGICFGGQVGFLVGATTTFLSNFLFGQGPWTPWQMFAMGLIGLLAGILFREGRIPRKRNWICLFGGISVFFIYGGLLNPASVLMFQSQPTWEMILLAYLRGIPFDGIHAVSTMLFLFFFTKPMLQKLGRIRHKYGILSM